MSHWKGVKIKVWANTHTTPSHSTTPDTRGLRPRSFHDNTVGVEEKMQCTELEAGIQAMKWAVGSMATVRWEWTTQGPQTGRKETQKGCLEEQLCPNMSLDNHTRWAPGSQLASVYGRAAVPKASFRNCANWEPPLARQTYQPVPFSGTDKNQKRERFWKTLSNYTRLIPQEKSAHNPLQLSMRSSGISQGRACFQK